MMSFFELHTRSAFSFLVLGVAAAEADAAVRRTWASTGVALLDRDTVAGAVRFHFEAKEHGIKPIIGAEITMETAACLPLVPMDLDGYQNLSG